MGPNYFVPYFVSKANELGGLNGNPDNPGGDQYDAFRHAYASALLASYSGNNTSKAIMDAYENKDPAHNWLDPKFSNYEKNRNMDLWNNDVGREEYYNWKKSFENGNTSDTLDVWIYNKVKEGTTINDFNEQGRTYIEPPLDSNDYSGENSSFSEILNGANQDFNV